MTKKGFKLFLVLLIVLATFRTYSQEFNCSISIATQQVEGTDKHIFETLEKALRQFINENKWTNFSLTQVEKLECSILINITERISTDEFRATMTMTLRRPVYKTSYYTSLFNYIDKDFTFKYIEYQPLDYSDNTFVSNLVSMMSYYIYVFLGLDFDTFSPNGGNPYFEKAQNIVNFSQSTPDKGWKSFENQKNRYWLVENLLNSAYSSVRQCLYKYHRLGLDQMYDNIDIGRNNITEALELLRKANREKPNLFIIRLFLDAKSDEIINIYSKAPPAEKTNVLNILKEIDPANSSKYQKIISDK